MRKLIPILLVSATCWAEGPYTLEECRRLARESNAEVRTAAMEVEGAEQTRKATFTKYFPQVSATGAVVVGKDPLINAPAMGLELGKTTNVLALMVQQPLFVGGRVVNGNRLAKLGEEVAQDKLLLARRDAVAQVEEKYWTLLSLQEKKRTLAAYDTLLGSLEVQVKDAVAHGLTSRNDLLKVSLKRSEAKVSRMQLESGMRLASRDLRQHMGLPEDTLLVLADTLAPGQDPSGLEAMRRGAVDKRIETRLLGQGVRAEELQADIESGTRLPTVAVGAQVFRADLKGTDPINNAIAYAMVSVPLTDAWSGTYSTSAKRTKVREASLRDVEMRRKLALGIDKDWEDLQRAYQSSLVSDEAVAQSEVNLNEESDRYRNGMSALSDLLEAQALRQQSLDGRVDARKDYWMGRSSYLRSVGRSEERP